MSHQDDVYIAQAELYDAMVSCQPDLSDVIREIRPFEGLDVLDLGAGCGRLSTIIAPTAKSLVCTDISRPMLDRLDHKLRRSEYPLNWKTVVSDHRELPLPDSSVDLIVSGWSICYLTGTENTNWPQNLDLIMTELQRVLRPGGSIIIFETMGTGVEAPNPPEFLTPYYALLQERYGFDYRWIRMDYRFNSVSEAVDKTDFFFGQEITDRIKEKQWTTVPECAGVWWRHFNI
ncbi:class I SAM-dependent methyltransferase [Paenibacillus aceti]|uniref:Methyltransferase type 11 domain-containing protein n=1 Tax=Paenibacillus aceti TaxID=1820010 RepID=A0ABQ1W4Z6_9BACL|nr:class I SAM-dependent methyltransferase [Paenibacillus aceti]GGG11666.1 hypothetical protein GCM10010913_36820 [Paenibacillus aceti]